MSVIVYEAVRRGYAALGESDFRAQGVGDDVVVWTNGTIEKETHIELASA